MSAQEIVRSRCVTAYELIESLVELVDGGALSELLAGVDSDPGVAADEGARAMQAIDAFAQQFGIDVESPV